MVELSGRTDLLPPMSKDARPVSRQRGQRIIGTTLSLDTLVSRWIARSRTTPISLARRAGINRSILSKILTGKQRWLMPDTAEKLANAMDIPVSKIYAAMRNKKSEIVEKPPIEKCLDRSKHL